jgi:hypothetical protein
MFRSVLTVFFTCVLCASFIAAQDHRVVKIDQSSTVARLQERSSINDAQQAAVNKYKVTADPAKNAVTGKPKPEIRKIPKVVPIAESLREEMSNSIIVGGGYHFQRVDGLPVNRVQGVSMTGFYYPVSWIGFGGEYQYGRGTQNDLVGNTPVQYRLTRQVAVFGPEFSGYPGENVRLFFHPMGGVAKDRMTTRIGNNSVTGEDTNFAMQLGGGMDLRITKSIAWRVAQFDYLGVRLSNAWQNNYRLQTGIAVRAH